jgi:hypothetical protein
MLETDVTSDMRRKLCVWTLFFDNEWICLQQRMVHQGKFLNHKTETNVALQRYKFMPNNKPYEYNLIDSNETTNRPTKVTRSGMTGEVRCPRFYYNGK